MHQATGVLYSGAWHSLPRHRCGSHNVFAQCECLYNRPHSCQVRKTAIFRCITRKKHQKRTEVYLSYMRVAFGVSDEVRRSIAQFLKAVFEKLERRNIRDSSFQVVFPGEGEAHFLI